MIYPFVCAFVRPAATHTAAAAPIFAERARLTRRWIETGNPQQPLTCVWIAASESTAESLKDSIGNSTSEPAEYSRCA